MNSILSFNPNSKGSRSESPFIRPLDNVSVRVSILILKEVARKEGWDALVGEKGSCFNPNSKGSRSERTRRPLRPLLLVEFQS